MGEIKREPAWLTAKADQRLALMADGLKDVKIEDVNTVLMTPLTEPPENATALEIKVWDRSCDNCNLYVMANSPFYTGAVKRELHGLEVILTYGVCSSCKDLP